MPSYSVLVTDHLYWDRKERLGPFSDLWTALQAGWEHARRIEGRQELAIWQGRGETEWRMEIGGRTYEIEEHADGDAA